MYFFEKKLDYFNGLNLYKKKKLNLKKFNFEVM